MYKEHELGREGEGIWEGERLVLTRVKLVCGRFRIEFMYNNALLKSQFYVISTVQWDMRWWRYLQFVAAFSGQCLCWF
jgi:hypothetical protein